MTEPLIPPDVDPLVAEHVIAIRDRFGVDGLREAARLIAIEIKFTDHAYDDLPHDPPELPPADDDE